MHKCVIIDDEPIAIDVIRNHIDRLPVIEIAGTFTSSIKAFTFLEKNPVDLVFLDIQMPRLTGLEIIRELPVKPRFIIISAYREYALDGYDLDVLDFLVKPVSYERFVKAVSKFIHTIKPGNNNEPVLPGFIFVKEGKKMTRILLDNIVFLESQRDYIRIIMEDGVCVTRGTISYYEQWLPRNRFSRVHRSFIVAISKMISYTEEEIMMSNKSSIPIGESYRKLFKQALQKHSL
jgi:DNA-binding LytR/AlgR family response regulator